MPQHKSAKKRMITNLKSQLRNRADMSILKTTLKKYKSLQDEEKVEGFKTLQSSLDRASKKGTIHKRHASRLKSRLSP
jgi:small subunit ribosomal protein S20